MKKYKIFVAILLCLLALACVCFAGWLVYTTIMENSSTPSASVQSSAQEEATPPEETPVNNEGDNAESVPATEEPATSAEPEAAAPGAENEQPWPDEPSKTPWQSGTPVYTAAQVDKHGEYSPLYCTVWPAKDLKIYASTDKKEAIGTAEACRMFMVIGEDKEAKLFKVRLSPDSTGYIDSNYCFINLTEYLGNLCAYDIVNSYDSLYMIHEYEIPGVTGTVIPGYENVRMADGTFLVPFLYVSTDKLIAAAQQALENGYRIRICDSYRPKTATNYIYNYATAIVYNPLPGSTYTGTTVSLPPLQNRDGVPEHSVPIYLDLIIYNGWQLGSFLAPGASMHNKGIALDLTFEDAETGEELSAQTRMHDLSAYSTIRSNNQLAKDIYNTLTVNSLKSIVSEWWHFQDNSLPKGVSIPFCQNGVSAQGWVEDVEGIGYRLLDGTWLKNARLVLEDSEYYFDENGYLIR